MHAARLQMGGTPGRWAMFESRHEPLAARHIFLWRFLRYFIGAALLVGGSLGAGILGYHYIAEMNWIDSVLNASMILGGMGPVAPLESDAAKLFASAYALVAITVMGMVLAPLAHRALHLFHLDEDDSKP
jgi:hypothetical protein